MASYALRDVHPVVHYTVGILQQYSSVQQSVLVVSWGKPLRFGEREHERRGKGVKKGGSPLS